MQLLLIFMLVLGAVGLFLVLPGSRGDLARLGWVVLAIGGGVLAAVALRLAAGDQPLTLFLAAALVTLLAAVQVITHRKPVYSALYFVLLALAVTSLLVQMEAEFLAAALVIVYGGAILVTYLFVIMLAQQSRPASYDARARSPLWGCVAGFLLLTVITMQLGQAPRIVLPGRPVEIASGQAADLRPADGMQLDAAPTAYGPAAYVGSVERVGTPLLTSYVVALQVIGVLLLAALVGAVAVARRKAADLAQGDA